MDRFVRKRPRGSAPPSADGGSARATRPKASRTKESLGFFACPECACVIAESQMVAHMTSAACRKREAPQCDGANAGATPKGAVVVADFISEDEERELLAFIDSAAQQAWRRGSFNGQYMAKSWGVRTDLARGTFQAPLHALPELFRPLVDRMRATVACLKDFRPNEANAIDYQRERGDFLAAHCDHRQLSGKVLVNLCLAGAATMTYQRDKAPPHEFRVRLGRRALQVQSGCVRYDFSHGIAHADLHDERRVSVTFRQDRDADANSQHCM